MQELNLPIKAFPPWLPYQSSLTEPIEERKTDPPPSLATC